MLKLTYAKHGPTGALRCYQHPKFGLIQTVTTWREPGAHIIRIETERDRAGARQAEGHAMKISPAVFNATPTRSADTKLQARRSRKKCDPPADRNDRKFPSAANLGGLRVGANKKVHRTLRGMINLAAELENVENEGFPKLGENRKWQHEADKKECARRLAAGAKGGRPTS